jgi:hypothetical protein
MGADGSETTIDEVTIAEAQQLIDSGEIGLVSKLWAEGMDAWVPTTVPGYSVCGMVGLSVGG